MSALNRYLLYFATHTFRPRFFQSGETLFYAVILVRKTPPSGLPPPSPCLPFLLRVFNLHPPLGAPPDFRNSVFFAQAARSGDRNQEPASRLTLFPARRDSPKAPAAFCPAAVSRLLTPCLLYALTSRLYLSRPFVKNKLSRLGWGTVLLLSWCLGGASEFISTL